MLPAPMTPICFNCCPKTVLLLSIGHVEPSRCAGCHDRDSSIVLGKGPALETLFGHVFEPTSTVDNQVVTGDVIGQIRGEICGSVRNIDFPPKGAQRSLLRL